MAIGKWYLNGALKVVAQLWLSSSPLVAFEVVVGRLAKRDGRVASTMVDTER